MGTCSTSCNETNESLYAKLDDVVNQQKNKAGTLIQTLHAAQNIFGYLPQDAVRTIAENYQMPLSQVSGVVSFYSHFITAPTGANVIKVCMGTSCYVRGSKYILKKLKEVLGIGLGETTEDKKFTIEAIRCFGECGLAPAIMINDTVYKHVDHTKLQEILNNY